MGCECMTEFFDRQIAEGFALAARKGMEQDERFALVEARDRIAGGEGKAQRPSDFRAEILGERKVTFDGVRFPIHRHDMIVKPARSFPRIARAVKLPRMALPPDECAPQ